MKSDEDQVLIECPFCGEDEFDRRGLKHHLNAGHCEQFNNTDIAEAEQGDRLALARLSQSLPISDVRRLLGMFGKRKEQGHGS